MATQSKTTPLDEAVVIRKLSLVSVLGNAVLSGFKLFAGVTGHSSAMISDAVHSFSDVLTTLIAWVGVKISKKDSDEEHPYGHERLECIASLLLGIVLLLTGLGIGKAGLQTIFSGDYQTLTVPGPIALAAAIISIVGKEAMYWYTRHYALLINSSAFLADAWHHRSDAFSSIGSLIGIGGAMLGFPVLDSVASVVICLFILKAAWDILADALGKMTDHACPPALVQEMAESVLSQPGVLGLDTLNTRLFGDRVYVDVEIRADGDLPLKVTHATAQAVHDALEAQFPQVKHCMVHVNPAEESA